MKCEGKKRHITEYDARIAADVTAQIFWKKGEDRRMGVYFCQRCYYWHVGTLASRERSHLEPLHNPLSRKEL